MNNLKIPDVLHVFSNFPIGGTEVRTCQLINYFGSRLKHTIISMNGCYEAKRLINSEIEVKYPELEFKKNETLANVFKFRKYLHFSKPEILITYSWGAIEWVIANSFFPICRHLHAEDGFFDEEPDCQQFKRLLIRKLFFSRPDVFVIPALSLQKIAEVQWGVTSRKIKYIPNGIDITRFTPKQSEKQEELITLAIVASLSLLKNHTRLLRAFSNVSRKKNCTLFIVGSGCQEAEICKVITSLGLEDNVKLLGYQDPAPILNTCDIFCLSSDHEQMPISVLEAMASGCAIVSTDVGDIKLMVADQNKEFIVAKEDERKYTESLERLINDRELRKAIGEANRKICLSKFSLEAMYSAYEQLYFNEDN